MGTWPIYKKTLPTNDLKKQQLSFDKISPHDFYFSFLFNLYLFVFVVGARESASWGLAAIYS